MSTLVRPEPLRHGDTVALVAPAGPVEPHKLAAGVTTLESWGLKVRQYGSVTARHGTLPYLAAPDEQRALEFERAWLDPEVRAVLAARGGYGCQRMLDLVDWPALRSAGPVVFAGASDTTALHAAIGRHLGLATLFAPMPATSHFDAVAAEHLRATLFEPYRVRALRGPDATTLVPGRAAGTLVGGNLSLLAAGLGSEQGSAPEGIALLEDVGEELYRLDRLLTQLLRAGWFAGVAGIALGSWTGCGRPESVRALLLDRLGPLGRPMVWQLGFGHHPSSLTIPLGVRAELDADNATLIVGDNATLIVGD